MMSDEMPVFGIYEKAVRPQSFEDMFRDARKAGYQSFELSIDASNGRLKRLFWGKKEAAEVWQAALRQDMKILTMCLSGHKRFPLGSSDPEITSAGMKIMEKALELGGRLGIRIIQLSGFDVYDQEERTEETRKRYVDNVFRASRMAERACVMLAIEPVEGNLLAVRDTMEVVRKIDSHCLQIYPDVANINSLGLGAAGIGGDTSCLAVKIGAAATHTAIAPVAVNFHCWVARRAGIRIYEDGRLEKIL